MRRKHEWIERMEDGRKKTIRVSRTGPIWQFQFKHNDEDDWTYLTKPGRSDLEAFRDLLERKYRRKRASFDDIKIADRMLSQIRDF